LLAYIYAPNSQAPNFVKQTPLDLKAQVDSKAMIVGDFDAPLSTIDRSFRQKNEQRHLRIK
jgi:hypothetical protein